MSNRINPWSIIILLIVGWWVFQIFSGTATPGIPYSKFQQYISENKVAEVTLNESTIKGSFAQPERVATRRGTTSTKKFTVALPPQSVGDPGLLAFLSKHNVVINTTTPSIWPTLLGFLGPTVLLIVFFWYFFMRNQGGAGQVMQFGQSRARMYGKEKSVSTTFQDVAGHKEVKRELIEVVDFLKNPEKYLAIGAEIPKGVLLVGPPGTGKTLLARAVAGEAGVPFFSVSASEFMEMFVGVGASRVRTLFDEARKNAPAIIFIDELDSIGRKRGAGIGGGHDEREQTLNQILSEMDGFIKETSVIVLAATNRPDILDQALLRPGRFDRQVMVGLPTQEERAAIFTVHMRNKPIDDVIDIQELARMTPGFSGADIKNLVNEAALQAAREDKHLIDMANFQIALDKIVLGLERGSLHLSEQEKRAIAYHEAGHAVISEVMPYADSVQKVTIVPRGMALGVTIPLPREEALISRERLMNQLTVMMGGRAAEEIFTGTITTGAANDFQRATEMARRMVLDWGMGEHFEHMAFGSDSGPVFLGEELGHRKNFSEETAREIDIDVRSLLEKAYVEAKEILTKHTVSMHKVAEALLETEIVPGDTVRKLLSTPEEQQGVAGTDDTDVPATEA